MKLLAIVLTSLLFFSCSSSDTTVLKLEKVETKMSQSYGPVQAKADFVEVKDGHIWFNVTLHNLSNSPAKITEKDFSLETSGPVIPRSHKTPYQDHFLPAKTKTIMKMAFALDLNEGIDNVIFRYSSSHSEMQEFFNVTK